jgi:hypothetical protein
MASPPTQNQQAPTADEKSLSMTFIGVASGLIAGAVFAAASYFEKVTLGGLIFGFVLGAIAIACFTASMIFGGKGVVAPLIVKGANNPFNRQVLAGLAGIVLLVSAAGVFTFNGKPASPVPEQSIDQLNDEIASLRRDMAQTQSEVTALRAELASHSHRQPEQR